MWSCSRKLQDGLWAEPSPIIQNALAATSGFVPGPIVFRLPDSDFQIHFNAGTQVLSATVLKKMYDFLGFCAVDFSKVWTVWTFIFCSLPVA